MQNYVESRAKSTVYESVHLDGSSIYMYMHECHAWQNASSTKLFSAFHLYSVVVSGGNLSLTMLNTFHYGRMRACLPETFLKTHALRRTLKVLKPKIDVCVSYALIYLLYCCIYELQSKLHFDCENYWGKGMKLVLGNIPGLSLHINH